jgi:hypothetical protein
MIIHPDEILYKLIELTDLSYNKSANNMPMPVMAFYQGRWPADPQPNGNESNFIYGNCHGSIGIKYMAAVNILARQ